MRARFEPSGESMETVATPKTSSKTRVDRRVNPRYRFSVPITIRCGEYPAAQGMTIEISETGLSAITAAPLKINDMVSLQSIAGGPVSALVRHNVGRIFGFEFLPLKTEQVKKIREICASLSRYPSNHLGI